MQSIEKIKRCLEGIRAIIYDPNAVNMQQNQSAVLRALSHYMVQSVDRLCTATSTGMAAAPASPMLRSEPTELGAPPVHRANTVPLRAQSESISRSAGAVLVGEAAKVRGLSSMPEVVLKRQRLELERATARARSLPVINGAFVARRSFSDLPTAQGDAMPPPPPLVPRKGSLQEELSRSDTMCSSVYDELHQVDEAIAFFQASGDKRGRKRTKKPPARSKMTLDSRQNLTGEVMLDLRKPERRQTKKKRVGTKVQRTQAMSPGSPATTPG